MFWIFAAVVLVLLVLHPGFRKVALYATGITGILGIAAVIAMQSHESSMSSAAPSRAKTACEIAAEKDSDARSAFFACGADDKE